MSISYKKNNNNNLFKNFEEFSEINNNQNYIPIYKFFFNITENNYNLFNLNNKNNIVTLEKKINYSKFYATIKDISNDNIETKKVFLKFSPILDPTKFLLGKIDISNINYSLPKYSNDLSINSLKINNPLNSSYCDGFFSYLSSILLNNYNFINGIDFYGSFIGLKKNFQYDISEDIDFLSESDFFKENLNKSFNFINNNHEKKLIYNTKCNKRKLCFGDSCDLNIIEISDDKINNNKKQTLENVNFDNIDLKINKYSNTSNNSNNSNKSYSKSSSSSSCSSRFSSTSNSSDEEETKSNDDDDSSKSSSYDEDEDEDEEDDILCNINLFPIQSIILECCEDTLDNYILNNKIKDNEWESIILQVLIILSTYQKCFNFTHNDLHTNNIVYINTNKQFLYYKINNTHYKIPTFGKIYKIIDFGRAIYQFNKINFFNDSYSKDGDAYSQYNCEPYYNSEKPRVEPNFSFDLSRLGCSLFDYFINDIDDVFKIKSKIKKLIISWVYDDNDKNILYKNDGSERYPDFKLYKMIARTVHKHIPNNVLKNEIFEKYIIPKKKINKSAYIFNIDELPIMI